MDPNFWGPSAWKFLHSITMAYKDTPSDKDKKIMKQFVNIVGLVLPCEKCKYYYYKHLEKIPLTDEILSNKKLLINWLIDIHNDVNLYNNKKQLTYDDAINKLINKNTIPNKIKINYNYILLFIIITLLAIELKK